MTRRTSRRDLLGGRLAQQPASQQAPARTAQGPQGGDSHLLQVSRPAMACEFQAVFNAGQYAQATEAAMEALDLVETLEGQLSYFRPASHISRLNLIGADLAVEISPDLFDLLSLALRIHKETEGAFDVTSAPLWDVWGFACRQGALPAEADVIEALDHVGSRYLTLDAERRTVQFTRPGIRLNLGSIGKGYALDRAAEVLARKGIGDFLLHGGQSSVLARGTRAGVNVADAANRGWTVGVRHPLRPKQRLAEIRLSNRALGTSGSAMQFFRHRGRRYAHILDPRTGRPAEGVLSVTVVASNAALADALSTAFFVLGPELAGKYCEKRPEVAALFVCPSHGGGPAEMHAIGFQPDEIRLVGEA